MSNSKQIDELVARAQADDPKALNGERNALKGDRNAQADEELLPLLMPEDTQQTADGSNKNHRRHHVEDDDEDLDNKSARKRLIDSLTDDEGEKTSFSLSYVLRGDILTGHWFRRQVWWIAMVIVMAFLYVSNRYYAQKQQILNEQLRTELKETHYDAMARSSQLMRNCRRSNIMERLTATGSTLATPDSRPAVIPAN